MVPGVPRLGLTLPLFRIHRHIGMGSDQLVAALAGEEWEERHGDDMRERENELYMALIDEVRPLDGARELLSPGRRGHALVLASSAKAHEVDHYLDLLDARELADGWTTSADVEQTKPEPDLVAAALEKAGGGRPCCWATRRGTARRPSGPACPPSRCSPAASRSRSCGTRGRVVRELGAARRSGGDALRLSTTSSTDGP